MDWGLFTKSNLQQWCVYLAVYEAGTGWNKRHVGLVLERGWRVRCALLAIDCETRKLIFTGTILQWRNTSLTSFINNFSVP